MSSWDSSSRRRKESSSASRLRMDSYNSGGRTSRGRASSKKRELDKVMKKARSRDGATQSNYWNKKLLEAEEKDPNRWRHSGYKELYGGGGTSPPDSRDSHKRSRSRSRLNRRRSPPLPARRSRSPERPRRPHTPPSNGGRSGARAGPSRRSPKAASLTPSSRSLSSCSDESCSVCSPKPKGRKLGGSPPPIPRKQPSPRPRERKKGPTSPLPPVRRKPSPRSRSRSFSVPRNRPSNSSPQPSRVPARRRERSSPPRDPRGPPPSPPPSRVKPTKQPRVKQSSSKKRKSRSKSGRSKRRQQLTSTEPPPSRRHSSPAPSCSEDSTSSSVESNTGAPKLTLSERFGKMAQWSVDRRDLDGVRNMRITKDSDGADLKVVIEDARYHHDRSLSPMPVSDRRVGAGYYPESLHSGPQGLDSWEDVRVRYKYYKDRGYLQNLTLDDYMKWEEWWYKYQDWLEAERYYARWEQLRDEQDRAYYPRSRRSRRV